MFFVTAWTRLPEVMRESMVLVGAIMIILGVSLASTNYLIDTEVPTRIFEAIREHVDGKLTFLILLNLFLLGLGMMLDIFSALVIVVPIILPIALGYGIDPVHLGIVSSGLRLASAVLAVAVLAAFPLYFGEVNASFAAGTIPHEALADELTRWAAWQWARTLLQIAAFAAALLGLRERLEH